MSGGAEERLQAHPMAGAPGPEAAVGGVLGWQRASRGEGTGAYRGWRTGIRAQGVSALPRTGQRCLHTTSPKTAAPPALSVVTQTTPQVQQSPSALRSLRPG